MLAAIVPRAHAAGLRVMTHVVTVGDFRAATDAGVDEITHLPMFLPDQCNADPSICIVDDESARRAAARGIVVVVAPFAWRDTFGDPDFKEGVGRTQDANLAKLVVNGVTIGLGSDGISGETPMATSLVDAKAIDAHHLLGRAALLRAWTETTARTIFPARRIGRLADGYEASFLVLEGDPLESFDNVVRIAVRVKQGKRMAAVE
jgi:imidazolonepropionase-like amidohydrolase